MIHELFLFRQGTAKVTPRKASAERKFRRAELLVAPLGPTAKRQGRDAVAFPQGQFIAVSKKVTDYPNVTRVPNVTIIEMW